MLGRGGHGIDVRHQELFLRRGEGGCDFETPIDDRGVCSSGICVGALQPCPVGVWGRDCDPGSDRNRDIMIWQDVSGGGVGEDIGELVPRLSAVSWNVLPRGIRDGFADPHKAPRRRRKDMRDPNTTL